MSGRRGEGSDAVQSRRIGWTLDVFFDNFPSIDINGASCTLSRMQLHGIAFVRMTHGVAFFRGSYFDSISIRREKWTRSQGGFEFAG